MAKNDHKLSIMVCRKIWNIHVLKGYKTRLKLSTMVGENFEIYKSQMAKNDHKLSHDWRKY